MKQLLMHMRRSVQKQPSTTLRYAMTTRFRVWDGEEMHEPPHQFLIGPNGSVFKRQEVEPAAPTGPVNAEVMHSTGLTDAEGREVWEGDVLEYTDGSPSHTVVVWNDDVAQFRIRLNNGDTLPFHSYDHLSDHYRVVGNRYEHPELMQEASA